MVAADLDELHRHVLHARGRQRVEVDRGAQLELRHEERKVLEREQQARAADVRVEERRLVDRRRQRELRLAEKVSYSYTLSVVSKRVLYTLYSVRKCLIHSI